jgi:hypothetical protein
VALRTGDGAGLSEERAVSLTAREKTEIVLLDLGRQLVVPKLVQREDATSSDKASAPRPGSNGSNGSRASRRPTASSDGSPREQPA